MASSSLFLICFFRNTSLLSFHVANADGYHSRVNTWGSWDSPQQLIAQTCWEGATEPASSIAFLSTAAVGWLSTWTSNYSTLTRIWSPIGYLTVILKVWVNIFTPYYSSAIRPVLCDEKGSEQETDFGSLTGKKFQNLMVKLQLEFRKFQRNQR